MPNPIINKRILASSNRPVAAYNAITSAFIAEVVSRGGTITDIEKTAINTFVSGLGSDVNLFDRLNCFGLQNKIAAKTSIVNPTSTMPTEVNSPTFIAGQGFQENASSSYLDYNFNPSVDGVNFKLNDAAFGQYYLSSLSNNLNYIGAFDAGSGYGTYYGTGGGVFRLRINDISESASSISVSSGLCYEVKTNGFKNFVNNNNVGTDIACINNGIVNLNLFILGLNINGVLFYPNNKICSFSFAGAGSFDKSNFYTQVQALGTTLGWAV